MLTDTGICLVDIDLLRPSLAGLNDIVLLQLTRGCVDGRGLLLREASCRVAGVSSVLHSEFVLSGLG